MKKTSYTLLAAAILATISFWPNIAATALPAGDMTYAQAQQDTIKTKKSSNRVHIVTGNDDKGKHSYININNGRNENLTYKGEVTLTDDFTSIKSISPGGYLKYSLSVDGDKKELELKSDTQGKLTRRYLVDGKEVAYAPAGEQWLQELMPGLIAKTGIGLEARVKDLYQKQGAKGVLAEADKVEGEHGKLKMVSYLLQQPNLKPADMGLALQRAGSYTSSDYELSKLLRNVPAAYLGKQELANAYLDAAGNVSSDYEKGKVLAHLLDTPNLNKQTADQALKVIGTVSSDYEKGKLVQKYISNKELLKNSYQGTFGLIGNFSSDYEKSKSIQSILNQHSLSTAQYQELLPVVRNIGSDYEKSKVLRAMAPKIPENATALRQDYEKVAKTISSDYEYRKVIEALK